MLILLEHIEGVALQIAGEVLIVAGIICLLVGLCMWLGGLRWSRLCAAFLGFIVGVVVGVHVIDQLGGVIGLGVVLGGFSAFFDKQALIVIGGGSVAGVCLLFFAWGGVLEHHWDLPAIDVDDAGDAGISESLSVLNQYQGYLCKNVSVVIGGLSVGKMVIAAGGAIVFVVAGFYMPGVMVSMSCSFVGSLLVFGGMIFLLLEKGSGPLTGLFNNLIYYLWVVCLMVVFGTFISLLLCPNVRSEVSLKKRSYGDA